MIVYRFTFAQLQCKKNYYIKTQDYFAYHLTFNYLCINLLQHKGIYD